jgi:hypothetical protein
MDRPAVREQRPGVLRQRSATCLAPSFVPEARSGGLAIGAITAARRVAMSGAEIEESKYKWHRDRRLAACLVAIALLLIAASQKNGDAYYTFLRIYVSGAAAILALNGWRQGQVWWPLSAAVIAILFNPIKPIEMYRDDWFAYDIGAAAWFGAFAAWPQLLPHHLIPLLRQHRRALLGLAVAGLLLAIIAVPVFIRLSSTEDFSNNTMNVDENLTADLSATVPQSPVVAIKTPTERLGDAFEAATGHRDAFTQTEAGDEVVTKPIRIIELPFGPALLTAREIKNGCHACMGAIGVFYLKEESGTTTVVGRWPKAVEGWGWGAPPSEWYTTDKFTLFPAIYASGSFMGQGVIEESATVTELRPTGPVTSDVIGTGFSDEGAIVDNERASCVVKGTITNIRKDRSFDVITDGSVKTIDHYIKKDGKFAAASKIDWGVPCDT